MVSMNGVKELNIFQIASVASVEGLYSVLFLLLFGEHILQMPTHAYR